MAISTAWTARGNRLRNYRQPDLHPFERFGRAVKLADTMWTGDRSGTCARTVTDDCRKALEVTGCFDSIEGMEICLLCLHRELRSSLRRRHPDVRLRKGEFPPQHLWAEVLVELAEDKLIKLHRKGRS